MSLDQLSSRRLDEISVALFSGLTPDTASFEVRELVPFIEWHWLRAHGHQLSDVRAASVLSDLQRRLKSGVAMWTEQTHFRAGFIRVRRNQTQAEDPHWISFLIGFSKGGRAAGLSKDLARQLTGVVKEMEDNVHCHSLRARSGLIAFAASPSSFEFVVVDRGIGVLESLRSNCDLASIADHGQALEFATTTGNSRFGVGAGRGWGFAELTVGIANANSQIRFRSGDHLLELDGRSPGPLVARSMQRAMATGFMVAVRVEV